MIISLGYRIKSSVATAFRIWATKVLKEYMIKGFAMDDDRLKGNYFLTPFKNAFASIGLLPSGCNLSILRI